uniref:Uncharacterized protein n=1 Tax=Fagus sylvatica TaxID=28930 RepID=A0A2N9GJR8_FAGSY
MERIASCTSGCQVPRLKGKVDMVVGSDSLITAEQRNKDISLAWVSPSSSLFPKPRVVRSSTAAPFRLYCRPHWSSLLLKCFRW